VRLDAPARLPQAQLDGFKTRDLRAEAPAPRHLYATDWRALGTQSGAACAPTLVLGVARVQWLLGWPRVAPAARPDAASQWVVVAAAATQRAHLAPRPLCALEASLALVQAQAATAPAPTVVLLTLGALPSRGAPSAAHAGAWGLARSARAEAQLSLRCIDSSVRAALGRGAALAEPEAALRSFADTVPRLVRAPSSLDGPVRLSLRARGAISNLFLEPQPACAPLNAAEVLLRVRAVGLNFRHGPNVPGE